MEINENKETNGSDVEEQSEELQEQGEETNGNEKLNRELEKKEQELAERELRITAREKLAKKGLPIQLSDALNCTSSEAVEKSILIIEKVINECKENTVEGIKFKGFQPGVASRIPDAGSSEDAEIRKIMKLN